MAVHKRKPLELVFNLQWINGDDKLVEQNMIGMVDSLTTSLSFEKFKSYLSKNSGVAADDIKVTYVNNKNREWVIDSEERFDSALQAFRLKARCGEKIHLKLERVSNTGTIKRTMDARTQCTQVCDNETPPEWFINYMKQFKMEVIDEIKRSMNPSMPPIQVKPTIVQENAATNNNNNNNVDENLFNNINCYKKLKKTRKLLPKNHHHHHYYHHHNNENQIDKELLRTLKYDRKLEIKLDKLDAKTKKIKEKKQALINKLPVEIIGNTVNDNNDENHQDNTNENHINNSNDTIDNNNKDDNLLFYDENGQSLMDAAVIMHLPDIKHMCGGEIYSHTWNVINKGKLSFTDKTELRWTWGSAELKPETKSIKLPLLNPGQIGTIKVTFQIPCDGGKYESYWNFYHGNHRFGSWLSCTIIVDPPPKLPELNLSPISKKNDDQLLKTDCIPPEQLIENASIVTLSSSSSSSDDDDNVKVDGIETKPESELSEKMDKIQLSDCSTIGIDDEDDDSDSFEKVVVYGISEDELIVDLPEKQEIKQNQSIAEEIKIAENKQLNQDDNNNNNSGAVSNRSSSYENLESDFVFVQIDGNKISLPRHMINPELLKNLKDENDVKIVVAKDDEQQKQQQQPIESNNFLTTVENFTADLDEFKSFISHCSTVGTNFSDTNPSITTIATTNSLIDSTIIKKDDKNLQQSTSTNESRLFIFPQNNPGYEVVKSDDNLDSSKLLSTTNEIDTTTIEPEPNYIWAQSQTQYTLADIPNRSVLEKFDPYRPEQQQQQQQFDHVPNYQQTPKASRKNTSNSSQYKATAPPPPPQQHSTPSTSSSNNGNDQNSQNTAQQPPHPGVPVHILPENLVSGAVNVASSAINTARSVINMMIPPKTEPGRWVNGHWVTDIPESKRSRNIRILVDMGFWDIDYNATLLARYNDDLSKVVDELLK